MIIIERRIEMKKFKFLSIVAVVFLFCGIINVNAATVDSERATETGEYFVGSEGTNVSVTKEEDGTFAVKLTGDAIQDIFIYDGEEVVLDLNGYTLTNFTASCEALKVFNGGKVTIIDSSEAGTGTITHKEGSTYGPITNAGTMIIEGGNFKTTQSFYVVRNENDLTINGGTFTTASSDTSLVGNIVDAEAAGATPTTVINNGEFTSNSSTFKNNANSKVVINGGAFTSNNAYAVDNWADAEITGGTFTSVTNSAVRFKNDGTTDSATLKITGGTMESAEDKLDIVAEEALKENMTITGGTFSSDISSYLPSDYELQVDDEGNLVVIEKTEEVPTEPVTPETPEDPEADIENPDTGDHFFAYTFMALVAMTGMAIVTFKSRKSHS